jgi:hypothetical protein
MITAKDLHGLHQPEPTLEQTGASFASERISNAYYNKLAEYLAEIPIAGTGSNPGFNSYGLPKAVGLAKRAGLSKEEAFDLIHRTQETACRETSQEIRAAIDSIYAKDSTTPEQPSGARDFSKVEQDKELAEQIASGHPFSVNELTAQSPVKNPESIPTSQVLEKLFPGNPLVTIGKRGAGESIDCMTRLVCVLSESLLKAHEYFVPNPAIKQKGKNKKGELSERCEEQFPVRKYLVIEFDGIPEKDKQAALLWQLREFAPLAMVVDSGHKSLHGSFECSAALPGDIEDFFAYACQLGADASLWKAEHMTRLPNAMRSDPPAKQVMLYFDPDANGKKWNTDALPTRLRVTSIGDIPKPENPEESNLVGQRYLTKGSGLEVVGPTGIGKSSLLMQMGMCWSAGKDFMGIPCQRPLRVLLVQAENDDEDLRAMRDGIMQGVGLYDEAPVIHENLSYVTVNDAAGAAFIKKLENLVKRHRPDIVILDPFFAFVGGNVSDQATVSSFLRGLLQKLMSKYGFACILGHHANKPPGKKQDRLEWSGSDFSYAGSGSAEIGNWSRAVMTVRASEEEGVYKLVFAKRHHKTSLRKEGKPLREIIIKHSPDQSLIYWSLGNEEDWPEAEKQKHDDLWRAVQKHAKDGEAKKTVVAKEMHTTTRTINRLLDNGPVVIRQEGKPTVTLTGGHGVITITVTEPTSAGGSTPSEEQSGQADVSD